MPTILTRVADSRKSICCRELAAHQGNPERPNVIGPRRRWEPVYCGWGPNKRGTSALALMIGVGSLGVDAAGADGGGDPVDGQHIGGDAIVDPVRFGVAEDAVNASS